MTKTCVTTCIALVLVAGLAQASEVLTAEALAAQGATLDAQITVDVIEGLGLGMTLDITGDGQVDVLVVVQSAIVDRSDLPIVFSGSVTLSKDWVLAEDEAETRSVVFAVRSVAAERRAEKMAASADRYLGSGLSITMLPESRRTPPLVWEVGPWLGVDLLSTGRGPTCEAGGPFATACSRSCSPGVSCSISCGEGSYACCRCVTINLLGLQIPLCTCAAAGGGGGGGSGCTIHTGAFCPAECPVCTIQAL